MLAEPFGGCEVLNDFRGQLCEVDGEQSIPLRECDARRVQVGVQSRQSILDDVIGAGH